MRRLSEERGGQGQAGRGGAGRGGAAAGRGAQRRGVSHPSLLTHTLHSIYQLASSSSLPSPDAGISLSVAGVRPERRWMHAGNTVSTSLTFPRLT
ncbi:hypothetical protein O3P69_015159 [Scylla paramamosain]|uniref:Uncharacterized protein n=1 Tax=Scylla paramamosain TaxID=85552 RepID=A0AAW0T303_SCYPA